MVLRRGVVTAAAMAIALGGVTSPSVAWEYPSRQVAADIWQATGIDATCGTGMPLPRKGIRVADAKARGFRWAAVNTTMTRCANGVLLFRSRVGGQRWAMGGSFGSDFVSPGSCSNVAGMPPRIVLDLTGMTCRGRSTPKVVRGNDWF